MRHSALPQSLLVLFAIAAILCLTACPGGVHVIGVSLDKTEVASIGKGYDEQLTATVLPSDATNKNIIWSTSDAAVATVSDSGLVTAKALGDVTITATTEDGEFTASCEATVTEYPLYREFVSIDIENNMHYRVPSTLRVAGDHCLVYVEDARLADIDATMAASIRDEFDDVIFDMIQTNFGAVSDVDENGRIILLIQDILDGFTGSGGYVAGFFFPSNEFSKLSYPFSNQADMIYLDLDPMVVGESDFYSTIAHELQHLVSLNVTYLEPAVSYEQEIWINEGLSSGAEYLYADAKSAGSQVTARIDYYNDDLYSTIRNGNNFFVWNGSWEGAPYYDQLADYSTVYLFFQWLQLHASNGTGIYKDIISSGHRDYLAVTDAASSRITSENGNDFSSWEELMRTWQIANLLCQATGDYGYLNNSEIDILTDWATATASGSTTFYPGEGVVNDYSGLGYEPTEGGNIRYAGVTLGGAVDTVTPYEGVRILTFNASSTIAGGGETGYRANYSGPEPAAASVLASGLSYFLPKPYRIDVSFGPDGKLAKDSHRPRGLMAAE